MQVNFDANFKATNTTPLKSLPVAITLTYGDWLIMRDLLAQHAESCLDWTTGDHDARAAHELEQSISGALLTVDIRRNPARK